MATDLEKMHNDYTAAWNSHDVERIVSFFTDDGVYEDVSLGRVNRGKKEVKDFINSMFVDFPDFKVEMKSSIFTRDRGATEWVMSGTFAHSSIPGLPATGKSFSERGASITEFRKNKISRNSDYWNMASFLQQVGLMPGPKK
jgi:steroid delta-isomerase-like uncharacterized protein